MTRGRLRRAIVAAGALGAAACVGGPPDGHAEQERLGAYVLDRVPSDVGNRLDIDYDGKIVLLGAKVEPRGAVRPGQKIKVTLFWQVRSQVGPGWNLFTHVLDGAGERIANLDNVGPLRQWRGDHQVFGPWAWDAGKIYIDEQDLTLPKQIRTSTIQIVTGIWKASDRLPIRSGPRDRHQRGIAAELPVAGVGAQPDLVQHTRVPQMRVDKLPRGAKITIDGKLDEPEWGRAGYTGPFRDVGTGQPNRRRDLAGMARLLWDDTGFYVGISVTDDDVTGGFDPKREDPHLWTRDTAEIMVDPDGDGDNRDYYEIQINPQNLVFDTRFDGYNRPVQRPDGPFGHEQWSAQLESAVVVDGSIDAAGKDRGYLIEARIPWSAFGAAKHAPPRVGDEWRMNFYAIENNSGVAWSPILGQGNFHKASRFGRVLWVEQGWRAPGAKPLPSASPNGSSRPSASAHPPLRLAPR
jgi:hypothetical protein